MHVRTLLLSLLTAAVALAGCSGGGNGGSADEPDTGDLDLVATEDTGIIRGVVVDDRIVPLAGVKVTLAGVAKETVSNEVGGFGFDGLEPGTYFIEAAKPGFRTIQQGTEVKAGVAEPPIVRILLAADPTTRPSYEVFHFQGYLECSFVAGTPYTGGYFMPCDVPFAGPIGSDNNYMEYPIAGNASWIHVSLVWDATQAFGRNLYFNVLDNYGEYNVPVWSGGPSPLLGDANATAIAESKINEQQSFIIEVASDGEAGFAGASLKQSFDAFIVVFHGFEPPEGYNYVEHGDPVIPE